LGERGESGEVEGAFELFVAASGGVFAADGGAGAPGYGCQAGVGGEMSGGGEAAGVTDVDEDAGGGPDPDAGPGGQDPGKRVGLQQFLDPVGEDFALIEDGGQGGGKAGDDQGRCLRAGNDDGLLVERVEDVVDQALWAATA
jgi:hypothetical protein